MKIENRDSKIENAARPIDVAAALYASRGWNFEKTMLGYLRSDVGYIFHGPTFFALARPVMLPSSSSSDHRAAWHVDVAVGKLSTLLKLIPFDLPYISFHRHATGDLRVYELSRFQKSAI